MPSKLNPAWEIVARLRRERDDAARYERKIIAEARLGKAAAPDHLWQDRDRLERKLQAATVLAEILDEGE